MALLLAQNDEQVVSDDLTTVDWVVAAAVLVGSVIVAQIAKHFIAKALENAGLDQRVARAGARFASYLIVLGGIVFFLVHLGVKIGSLLAAFAALGVAVAFAVQDDLRNMWAGIQIQSRRPFKLGDQIATGDWVGTVEAINLRATTLRTPDGKQVAVPNGNVMLRGIDNRTTTPIRRTALTVGVAYDADLEHAQRILVVALRGVKEVEPEPEPEALVEEFGDSAINFAVRFWHGAENEEMWSARSAAAIAIKRALDEAAIDISFPQVEVSLRRPSEADDDGASGSS